MDKKQQYPEPAIVEDKKHKVTYNESLNPAIEKICYFKYYFPINTEPNKEGDT